ncbi:hypothetical protein, conserved [Eimeria praecox]|uniref:Uncharacterized protein n=1 Tax=Eimeria praecox TaxID=51316 RepID=U6GQ07_9EIME|nr:hypothetical protein, conserved [Eimeria praecox]
MYIDEVGLQVEKPLRDTPACRLQLLRLLVAAAVKLHYEDTVAEGSIEFAESSDAQQQQQQQEQQQQQQQQQQEEGDAAVTLRALQQPVGAALEALKLPPLLSDASPQEILAALKAVEARAAAATGKAGDIYEGEQQQQQQLQQVQQQLQQLPLLLGPRGAAHLSFGVKGLYEERFAAAVLLLLLQQLQQTQDRISETLERLQLLTADPKTDYRQARVGR